MIELKATYKDGSEQYVRDHLSHEEFNDIDERVLSKKLEYFDHVVEIHVLKSWSEDIIRVVDFYIYFLKLRRLVFEPHLIVSAIDIGEAGQIKEVVPPRNVTMMFKCTHDTHIYGLDELLENNPELDLEIGTQQPNN